MEKVDEELAEFHAETDLEKKGKRIGRRFLLLINYARISNLNADSALERTNVKFINCFKTLEKLALEKNLQLSEMSLQEMDVLWEEKSEENWELKIENASCSIETKSNEVVNRSSNVCRNLYHKTRSVGAQCFIISAID